MEFEAAHLGYCALLQNRFDGFVEQEVVPAIRTDCRASDIEIVAAGASIGAFNAVASLCRRPFVLDTIEIFGIERCMFASNFPVDRLSSDYDRIWNAFDRVTADFPEPERRALFCDNAIRHYRL